MSDILIQSNSPASMRRYFEKPVSLWLTGLRETIGQLEAFVRPARQMDVAEVYLRCLVFFNDNAMGLARAESALFEKTTEAEEETIRRAEELALSLGVTFNASGATEPGTSVKQRREDQPWSLCRRPWTLMYFTATGRAALLHRTVLHAWIRQLYPGRCDAGVPPGYMEWRAIRRFPRQLDGARASAGLR